MNTINPSETNNPLNKKLITITTIIIIFPIYLVLKISSLPKYATFSIIIFLLIAIPIALRWANNKYNELV